MSCEHRVSLDGTPTAARLLASGSEAVLAERLARARAEGFESGVDEGRQRGSQVLDAAVQRLTTLEHDAHAALSSTAVEVAIEIARVLLRREIAAGNYDIEKIVRETLAEAAVGRAPCRVHVNPVDYVTLETTRFRSGTEIASDTGVPRGDVHVETTLGVLVRDVDVALQAIRRRMQETLT